MNYNRSLSRLVMESIQISGLYRILKEVGKLDFTYKL
jgi:hypothetical protein